MNNINNRAGTIAIILALSLAVLTERTPHPNIAILFADWFTSTEGQQIYLM